MNEPTSDRGTRRRQALAAAAGIVLAATALAAGTHDTALRLTAEQAKALGVESAPLEARHAGEIPGLPAVVAVPARQQFVVAAPLPGLVESLAVSTDARVSRGQVLARLRSPELAEMRRGLAQSATQTELARENLRRDEQLVKEGIIAESRLRESRSRHAEAAAAYAERRQALRLAGLSEQAIARLQAGKGSAVLDIAAPADGVVIEQSASPGQRVEANAQLFRLAKLDPLWLEIQLPVARSAEVSVGASVTVAAVEASGKVISVGRSTGAGQTVLVRAEISKGAAQLRPGQFVEATLATAASGERRWSVPNQALIRVQGRLMLLVQTAEGYRPEPVQLASGGAQHSLVTGPFEGDERIAVAGLAALKAMLSGIGGE
jgi:RND family efflux transporter MFP subunit